MILYPLSVLGRSVLDNSVVINLFKYREICIRFNNLGGE